MLAKIELLAERRGWTQGEVESMTGLPRGRITKWKSNQGKGPSVKEGMKLARLLGVSLDYLADDLADNPGRTAPLSEAEQAAVDLVRALELSKEEAIRRLAAAGSRGPGTGYARWVATRDETDADVRRECARGASGSEPDAQGDHEGAEGGDVPRRVR